MINKPDKPDYSLPKAYRPISLLECAGKLLEKVVTNRINRDITMHRLLPMTQFRSCPNHCAMDTVATLVHCIQATRATDKVGALLLFDISGFFDNINPECAVQKFADLGFLPKMCQWTKSFLTNYTAELKVGTHISAPFQIPNGTP